MVSWPFECPSDFTYSFDVALSRKELSWILKSTKSPDGGNSSLLGVLHKAISCVKLASSLMTYGNTWFWNYRGKQNVSWFLARSLTIGSRYLSKFHSEIHECSVGISALDRCQSTHLIAVSMGIPYPNIIVGPWEWSAGPGCTDQEYNRASEWFQARFKSSSSGKHWLWDIYRIREGYQWGNRSC